MDRTGETVAFFFFSGCEILLFRAFYSAQPLLHAGTAHSLFERSFDNHHIHFLRSPSSILARLTKLGILWFFPVNS
jgi:hypothetical protein